MFLVEVVNHLINTFGEGINVISSDYKDSDMHSYMHAKMNRYSGYFDIRITEYAEIDYFKMDVDDLIIYLKSDDDVCNRIEHILRCLRYGNSDIKKFLSNGDRAIKSDASEIYASSIICPDYIGKTIRVLNKSDFLLQVSPDSFLTIERKRNKMFNITSLIKFDKEYIYQIHTIGNKENVKIKVKKEDKIKRS